MSDATPTRCAVVAVIGAPNAGKSTLVNALVGQKVSIVTHKVQTTRFQVRGIALAGPAQIVLVDTPGIFKPKRRLDRAMVRAAWTGADDADATIHVVDAEAWAAHLGAHENARRAGALARMVEDDLAILDALKAQGRKVILALNKIDLIQRAALLPVTKTLSEQGVYTDTFMIAASRADGVAVLLAHLAALAPEGPWLFPEDQISDAPSRLLASEITREKAMLRLHEELPYQLTVETEAWTEKRDGSVKIDQTIFVANARHRSIALGKGGAAIKAIGEAARAELAEAFGRTVHLFLHVQVDERWQEDRRRYRDLGLDFDA